nr:PUCXE14 protein [Pyrus ussuriensis]
MAQNNPISPNLPCKVRLLISILTTVIDATRRSNGTVNRRLMSLFDFKASPSDKPNNAVKTSDVMVDPSRNLWFRLYVPTTTDPASKLPLVIYFHGGGFVFFSANSKPYNDLCKRLATKLPAVIISVNYRHAPEHRYPSQYEDGMDVLKFIDTTRIEGLDLNNVDITRCFLAGDSAGGNLAHHVVIKTSDHEFCQMRVMGLIAIQPFFGGKERTESETRLAKEGLAITLEQTDWYWKAFLPEGSNRDHAVVNVFGPESSGILGVKFPATIVFMGGFDPLQDWQKMYYQGLKKKGIQAYLIEYPNSFHGFYVFPELKESSFFIKELKDFIDKLSTC